MNIILRWRGDEHEVGVEVGDEPLAELLRSLVGLVPDSVIVDGCDIGLSTPIPELGLGDGSVIELKDSRADCLTSHIRVAAGGEHVAGDSHETKTLGQRHGVFNRPPRPIHHYERPRLHPPVPPEQPAKPTRFGWAALIAPLVLGLGMAVLIHPRMAVFALFSPVMLLANWLEDRRRVRRERRETGVAHRDALDRFRGELWQLRRREISRRRSAVLTPPELEQRAASVDPRLWQRRTNHEDFLTVPIGSGCVPWEPEWATTPDPDGARVFNSFAELHDIPVVVDLDAGDIAGVVGHRSEALGVTRQLLGQVVVEHGPADVGIGIFTERPEDWDWAKWLPHVVGSCGRLLAGSYDEIAPVVTMVSQPGSRSRRHLLIVDLPDLLTGPGAMVRRVLQEGEDRGIAAIVISRRTLDLPSLVTTVVMLDRGQSNVRYPDGATVQFAPWVLSARTSRRIARALARVDDPESIELTSGLPATVHLASLLGLGEHLEATIAARWRIGAGRCAAPVGVTDGGPFTLDLVADGPHALLGGTTGAGKSELLRSLVASLAATTSPAALNFVLIDYKGGSAFDACSGLPHTVGVVTDLDDRLAARALQCLDAELRYREGRLRDAAVPDISDLVSTKHDSLPRLLVVIDEFAALAVELPDFLHALVGIAQRGRSLGVHLLLATQRPSGVIDDKIRANTNLRMALRVQDAADSIDVIGSADAATISRINPGRGLARLGPGDTVAFQTALVTGHALRMDRAAIAARPFVFAVEQPSVSTIDDQVGEGETDLERIVAACSKVAERTKLPAARLPWPDPLPERITLADLPDPGVGRAAFGLADEPHRQRQVAAVWSPASGNLLLYGLPGSGTSTALASIAIATATSNSPDQIHIYVLDFDDQMLQPLRGLPHVGAVVSGGDRERQLRLLRRLDAELGRRRQLIAGGSADSAGYPAIVTLLDNYGGFAEAYGEPGDMAVHALVTRIISDGPGVGILTILTAKHASEVPTRVAAAIAGRLLFRLADRYDYSSLGVPPVDPPKVTGRAFESGSGREIQIALSHSDGLPAAVEAISWGEPAVRPWSIDVLPASVALSRFIGRARLVRDEWYLPIGIGDSALAPVGLTLGDGDHALIAGPSRSGKTTALLTIAAVARAADPGLRIAAIAPRRSDLTRSGAIDLTTAAGDLADLDADPTLLLVDDAELVGDGEEIERIIAGRDRPIRIVAAGSINALRSRYGHWTQELRRSRIGCLLRPNSSADGDLWQIQLPRVARHDFPVGRGYLITEGRAELFQLGRG